MKPARGFPIPDFRLVQPQRSVKTSQQTSEQSPILVELPRRIRGDSHKPDHAAAILDARLFQVQLLSEWLQQTNSDQASPRSDMWRRPRLAKDLIFICFYTSHGGLWPLPVIGDVGILSYCAVPTSEHQPNFGTRITYPPSRRITSPPRITCPPHGSLAPPANASLTPPGIKQVGEHGGRWGGGEGGEGRGVGMQREQGGEHGGGGEGGGMQREQGGEHGEGRGGEGRGVGRGGEGGT